MTIEKNPTLPPMVPGSDDVEYPERPEWLPITYQGEFVLEFWADYLLWMRGLWWYTPNDSAMMQ